MNIYYIKKKKSKKRNKKIYNFEIFIDRKFPEPNVFIVVTRIDKPIALSETIKTK